MTTTDEALDPIRPDALIDPTGVYRYWLTRTWDPTLPRAVFVMLNPSTADALQDDPTIRRCCGFAFRWNREHVHPAGGIHVVNLFAYRATDPAELEAAHRRGVDIIGPENEDHLQRAVRDAALVVAAWGAHPLALARGKEVTRAITESRTLHCLQRTKASAAPSHPLYLKAALDPSVYAPRLVPEPSRQ